MRTYLEQQLIDISRQVYVANKSSYANIASSVGAYVRPLNEEEATINGLQYGLAFFAMVDDVADVQEADIILFDGDDYVVKGVARHNRGISLPPFKQITMTRKQGT